MNTKFKLALSGMAIAIGSSAAYAGDVAINLGFAAPEESAYGVLATKFEELAEEYVRRQSFSECFGFIVTEALVRLLFQFRRQRIGAASGVFGMSVS